MTENIDNIVTPKTKGDCPHEGHRERMRERFMRKQSFEDFSEHEVLELMLFYVMPRMNTNEIAHRLIKEFGTLDQVLNAPFDELCRIEGLGRNSAVYLKMLMKLCTKYHLAQQRHINISESEQMISYIKYHFVGIMHETSMLFGVTSQGKLCAPIEIGRSADKKCAVDVKNAVSAALECRSPFVLLAHNHLGRSVEPSGEDEAVTKNLKILFSYLGIELLDHIIVSGEKSISMRGAGLIDV